VKGEARLPDPGPDAAAFSAQLLARIQTEIEAADGFLPFERFMDLALYAPGLGYYVGGAHKFGAAGDFVTAPELSPLFGACVAEQCAAALAAGGEGIIEFGGGSGKLAASVLAALAAQGYRDVPYAIVELSPELRERQQAWLTRAVPDLCSRVEWWQGPPAHARTGAVLANEILDALPVTCLEWRAGQWLEVGVIRGDIPAPLRLATRPASRELQALATSRLQSVQTSLPEGYRTEFNRRQAAFLADLSRFLSSGVAVLADYGYPRHEYYHPERSSGTLQCHYRHLVHGDPLWAPGLQDITASVDFTSVAEDAEAAGWDVAGFTEQAQYLMACGITDKLQQRLAVDEAPEHALQAVKRLLLPQEMGTRVKLMTLARDYAGTIVGYTLRDARHRL
jgi:SAM-dependent MidA family methyltransferase